MSVEGRICAESWRNGTPQDIPSLMHQPGFRARGYMHVAGKDVHVLIPGTCDYVVLCGGQKDFPRCD